MAQKQTLRLRPGDLVEVKAPQEILQTLDAEGTVDKLPFMPEMIDFCGKRFRVARVVVKTCSYTGGGTNMRTFQTDDVVTLQDIRCSGCAHDGCPKGCTIFWRDAWLRKVDDGGAVAEPDDSHRDVLRTRLKTKSGPATYFCQASELLKATNPLSRWARFGKCVDELRAGNCTVTELIRRIAIWVFWRIRRVFFGAFARGRNQTTPAACLNLQAGEQVNVKSLNAISDTLNATGHNRGLWFSPDMRLLCGATKKVDRQLDKIIVDGTGQMRELRGTVYLEGSYCSCAHVAFGGCSRDEYVYWREIWLQRAKARPNG